MQEYEKLLAQNSGFSTGTQGLTLSPETLSPETLSPEDPEP